MQVPCNEAPKPLFALGKMLYGIAMVNVKCCVHNERAFLEEHKLKIKQVITGIAALACVSTAAHAQSAGSFYATAGWFHFAPQDSSGPLKETSVGGSPVNIDVPGTGAISTTRLASRKYVSPSITVAR